MSDSFPEPFLAHLSPLLFVAGLEPTIQFKPAFDGLIVNLRKVLSARSRFSIWDINRGNSTQFHIVLVDKNVKFPPRKAKAPADGRSITLHSPISPLTPGSPLHPDGIIAPIWIRKHREMLPCAFILALSLFEPDQQETGPLGTSPSEQYGDKERKMDAELVAEILERKRMATERSIKMAVILFASKEMLESNILDYRLSLIRRQSGLDSRASLFVISPVSLPEVQNFVASLQRELYDSAIDYFKDHGRRVRRKKGRVPTAIPKPIGQQNAGTPASATPQAWTCRYDYKLGSFAEFRQEFEVALKHYEDCYNGLLDMFSSTQILVPRTKRWLEAKVLADCTNAKIFKLYLYIDDSSRAVAQLNKHMYRFRALCESWQIGESTFEFWSWASKQYRLIAEILDLAVQGGFRIPAPSTALREYNPFHTLQHAGHYYLLAALSAIERKDRFDDSLKMIDGDADEKNNQAALDHEKNVNHGEQILDLLTKSYEGFKQHKSNRTSLAVVALIASSQLQAQKHEVALKFYERIAQTYQAERWQMLLRSILSHAVSCAKESKDAAARFRIAFQLLESQTSQAVPNDAFEILKTSPAQDEDHNTIDIDLTSTQARCINAKASFASATCRLGHDVAFKLAISISDMLQSLTFTACQVVFETGLLLRVKHKDSNGDNNLGLINMDDNSNQVEHFGNLQVPPGKFNILSCRLQTAQPVALNVASVLLTTQIQGWLVNFTVKPVGGILTCLFAPPDFKITMDVKHEESALLDEHFPILISLKNDEQFDVSANLTIKSQSSSQSSQALTKVYSAEASEDFTKPVPLAPIKAGGTLDKQIVIIPSETLDARRIHFSVSLRPALESAAHQAEQELTQIVTIPVILPFECGFSHKVHLPQSLRREAGDFLCQPSAWENAEEIELDATLRMAEDTLLIQDVSLMLPDELYLQIAESTLLQDDLPISLNKKSSYNISWLLKLLPQDTASAFLHIQWSRSDSAQGSLTKISLPKFKSLLGQYDPFVIVCYPQTGRLFEPHVFTYRISNLSISAALQVSTTIESSPDWVLSASRKISALLILPGTTHEVSITAVPINRSGLIDIPRLRAWQKLEDALLDDGQSAPRTRELPVLPEGFVLLEDLALYDEDGQANKFAQVTILP